MKRTIGPLYRYGEPDFDTHYVQWGFHDEETRAKEADSILWIAGGDRPLNILDLGCGTGFHAVHWAKLGHTVVGVDLSGTFIKQARERASREEVSARFIVSDIKDLAVDERHDLVTWIANSFFDEAIVALAHTLLNPGGCCVVDERNPENPRVKSKRGNWRTWREENGIFYLERHETDEKKGFHEDVWITIDPERDLIDERTSTDQRPLSLDQKIKIMETAGFDKVELRTMEGELFLGGPGPDRLWLVAKK